MPRTHDWLRLALVAFVVYRIGYHAVYLGEVPFAIGAISDGAVYERAARDIADHFPLGTRPFYLQGAYAYLLSLGLLVRPWISLGLLVQMALAGAALWAFHRTMKRTWGPAVGGLSTLALLAYPGLAFYENKYLTASMGVSANIVVLAALVWAMRGGSRRVVVVGLATGLAFLARSNLLVAVPFIVHACVIGRGPEPNRWSRIVFPFALGFGLAVAPMAMRNQAVTGHPDVMPVHGGGTSFYIGNNPEAHGVWNDANGLLSARVEHESAELARQLDVRAGSERDQARAVGEALYARAFAWIAEHPGEWAALELHKLWLTLGNQELTQDYDWYGERELLPYAHRVGLPFGLLLALGIVGIGVRRRIAEPSHEGLNERERRAVGWLLVGQVMAVLAATLLFFTSSQHRLPLCVPLAVYAGPGLWIAYRTVAARLGRAGGSRVPLPSRLVLALAAVLLAQAFLPRMKRTTPHPVHYYNLAVALDQNGEPLAALTQVERAIELDPEQPFFRLERATLRRRLGDAEGARADVEWLWAQPGLPPDVRQVVRREWWATEELRRAAGLAPADLPDPP